jgi:hypothetical protein
MTAADAAGGRLKMKTFTIENETNNITIHASATDAEAAVYTESFGSEATLATLAAGWSTTRLVEIWNSLAGVTQVKKFKDRATAVSRIWKAIQTLGDAASATDVPEAIPEPETAPVIVEGPATEGPVPAAPHAPDAEPEKEAPGNNEADPATDATAAIDGKLLRVLTRAFDGLSPDQQEAKWVVLKNALATRKTPDSPKLATIGTPREGSKISQVIEMLKREGGTGLAEIMSAMAWQKHTTRAMLSAGGSLAKTHGLVVTSEKVGKNRIYSIKA